MSYKHKPTTIYLCVDKDGTKKLFSKKDSNYQGPIRGTRAWLNGEKTTYFHREKTIFAIYLQPGTIKKLLGYDFNWYNEPVKYQ